MTGTPSGPNAPAQRKGTHMSAPFPAGTYRAMTEFYLYKGDIEKARELHSKVERLDPTHRWSTWMRGFIAGYTGDKKERSK